MKCALCNKEILQMKLNLNFISVSDMSINVHSFECYLVQNNCRPVLNKLWQSFYYKKYIFYLFIIIIFFTGAKSLVSLPTLATPLKETRIGVFYVNVVALCNK